jgi:hypothetical protein
LLFVPLASLSNAAAYFLWLALNLCFLGTSLWLLLPSLESRWRCLLLSLLLAIAFYPAGVALLHGQDSFLTLLIYALTFAFLRRGKDWQAGAILALGLYKPQLILPFALLAFVVERRWRAVAGFSVTGVVVALLSIAATGWSGALRFVPFTSYLQVATPWFFNARLMANLRGILESQLSRTPSSLALTAIASIALLAVVAVYQRRLLRLEVRFAVQICATLLVSYHLYPYDLTLLLIPLLLAVDGFYSTTHRNRWLIALPVIALLAVPLHTWLVMTQQYFWIALLEAWLLVALYQMHESMPQQKSSPSAALR